MENISCHLIINQENSVSYEAGLTLGFCILLAKIAFLTETYIEEVDFKNQPGKKEHQPPRYHVLQMYAGIAQPLT